MGHSQPAPFSPPPPSAQICNRCIRRFDHHCPAVGNCVGEGNQRVFLAFLITMCLAQVRGAQLLKGGSGERGGLR